MRWAYAILVVALFVLLCAGIGFAPDVLGRPALGPDLTWGVLLAATVHVLPVILAIVYLRSRSGERT